MTKQDPFKLCPKCQAKQDLYDCMEGKSENDVMVVCEHWIEGEEKTTPWIKFSDRKPAPNQWVIVWRKELREPFQMTWGNFNRLKEILLGDLDLLTHWMPLPKPLEEENAQNIQKTTKTIPKNNQT
jgi:hypothetical protein